MRYLWALPNTLIGLAPLPILLLQRGAHVHVHTGVLELSGGIVTTLLRRGVFGVKPGAMTLGHVVWGLDPLHLQHTRPHERIHVRQYERWGPFFLPAYLLCSLVQHLRGKNHYLDNPFEREAYGRDRGCAYDDSAK